MQKVFFISDHHFGHKLIIDFETRPFENVEVMNASMIESWNSVVGKNDKVFHLGDFSFLNREKTAQIVAQLHGYKHLILGNHDRGRSRAGGLMLALMRLASTRLFIRISSFLHMSLCT